MLMMEKLAKISAAAVLVAFYAGTARAQTPTPPPALRIVGAATAVLPVKDAGDILKKDKGLELQIAPMTNSNGEKIAALGENYADVAIVAREVTALERAPYPDIDFRQIQFGEEAVAVAVSKDVWDAGVHSLTRDQARGIYESKIKNWKEVGGPDLPLTAYSPDPKLGTWACYVQWLYDDPRLIPDSRSAQTKTDDEAKAYLESTPGSIVQVSLLFASDNHLHALAIKADDGKLAQPTIAGVADHSYPVARPLIMVVKGRPLNNVETFVKFMLGDQGQQFVHKYSYLTLKELGITPDL
ncbi:MAG TPA: substrate-binding domain-containing protein [Chthoniobacteraceae bacterium]|nr:substrate-binding domain-containing protein [Chthoniobacteraceae bacterium]